MAIQKLSDECIRLLSAGEVIQRPVNVVKELLENSLDSKAKNITVKIMNGGLSQISVVDDGEGISPQDMNLICSQHHTSKIADFSEMNSLDTYGFRGEALHSICSISRMTITSRTRGCNTGFVKAIGQPKVSKVTTFQECGTHIDVFDLFYNLAIRRRILEKNGFAKEVVLIKDLVVKYGCFLGSEVNLSLYVNNSMIFNNARQKTSLLSSLLSRDGSSEVSKIALVDPISGVQRVDIFYSKCASKNDSNPCISFVNGRLCEISHINKALNAFVKDCSIGCCFSLYLELDISANSLDCNVSPTKNVCFIPYHVGLLDIITDAICKESQKSQHLPLEKHGSNKKAPSYPPPSNTSQFKVRSDPTVLSLDHYANIVEPPKNLKQKSFNCTFIGMVNEEDCLIQVDEHLCLFAVKKAACRMIEADELKPESIIYLKEEGDYEAIEGGCTLRETIGIIAQNGKYFSSKGVVVQNVANPSVGTLPAAHLNIELSEVVFKLLCSNIQKNRSCRYCSDFFEFFVLPKLCRSTSICWHDYARKITDIPFLFKNFERC